MADDRNLVAKSINRFRGISQHRNIAGQPMEWAQDCMNVIVSGAGYLEKFRAPLQLADKVTIAGQVQSFIDILYDFQQAIGTRQLFAAFKEGLGYYTEPVLGAGLAFTAIEHSAADAPRWSFIDSNNLLFGANGIRMIKWTGAAMQQWGITRPTVAPTIGKAVPMSSIQRTAGVVSVTMDTSGFSGAIVNGFHPMQLKSMNVGDTVKITGTGHADVEGNVVITAVTGAFKFQYAAAGANFGPLANTGTCLVYTTPCGGTGDFGITQIARADGVVSLIFANNYRILPGEDFTLSGFTVGDVVFNGDFVAINGDLTTVTFAQPGPDFAFRAPSGAAIIAGGFTDVLGPRTWRYSYGNSVIGDESAVSDQSLFIPNSSNGLVNHTRAYLNATASPDPQVDTIFWFATLDSGSDWFLDGPSAGIPTAQGLTFGDGNNDALLDETNRGSFINFPPPVSTKLSKWQGRIYMVPVSNPQSIIYTGYEKILRGRPECNVPPQNQIQLQVGASTIKGHGPLMNGVVIWDGNDHMFMFKGTIEDIVTTQPINYSEQLEELPWAVGVMSHETIQPTPYGLIWFGSDKTFHKWNGIYYGDIVGPVDIGQNIYPLLARITPGTEGSVQSAYFNFLERDWYVALICVDGSMSPNRILFFDVSKDAQDNLGVFVTNTQADAITVRVDANNIRHLLVTVQGRVFEVKAATTSTAGIHKNMTKTSAALDAFWLSGYDGNDTPLTMKMYRFGRLVTDQGGFNLVATLLDDEVSTFLNPRTQFTYKIDKTGKFAVNWKARRMSIEIRFPKDDVDASVLQLTTSSIPLGER